MATSAGFKASPGYTYCFSVRAHDAAGKVSRWAHPACTAIPLDDRSLTRSAGWTALAGPGFYRSTALRSSSRGAKLTRTGPATTGIALLATTCPTCGTVKVYWNARLLRTVSLSSATRIDRKLIPVVSWWVMHTGTLTIKVVSSGKKVIIDGLAIRHLYY